MDDRPPRLHRSASLLLIASGLLSLGGAIALALVAAWLLRRGFTVADIPFAARSAALQSGFLAAAKLAIGIGLWRRRRWAWWGALTVVALALVTTGFSAVTNPTLFRLAAVLIDGALLWILLLARRRDSLLAPRSEGG